MPSRNDNQMSDDENSNPGGHGFNKGSSNSKKTNQETPKGETKPLQRRKSQAKGEGVEKNLSSIPPKKRGYWERKHQEMFRKSGMKEGALLNYVLKSDKKERDTESNRSPCDTTSGNVASAAAGGSDEPEPEANRQNVETLRGDGEEQEEEVTSSQDSDVICLGEVPRNRNAEIITVDLDPPQPDEDEANEGGVRGNDADIEQPTQSTENQKERSSVEVPQSEEVSDSDTDFDDDSPTRNLSSIPDSSCEIQESQHETVQPDSGEVGEDRDVSPLSEDAASEVSPSLLLDSVPVPITAETESVGFKRRFEDEEDESESTQSPPKVIRRTEEMDDYEPRDIEIELTPEGEGRVTPELSSSTSFSSPPPLKIVSIRGYTGVQGTPPPIEVRLDLDDDETCSNGHQDFPNSDIDRARRSVLIHEARENVEVESFIKKRNWKKAIAQMKKDLEKYHLPMPEYVAAIISGPILCEDMRVNKDVQKDCAEFLEHLVNEYAPPGEEKRNHKHVQYYKKVFEKVFDETSSYTNIYCFLQSIIDRVSRDSKTKSDSKALWLFNLVTNLATKQYEAYEKQDQKIKPPLFQYFFEAEVGSLRYKSCEYIVEKLFENETYDEFCLYLKWIDLLAKRFSYRLNRDKYVLLIEDMASRCEKRSDLGLLVFMNSKSQPFAVAVCEKLLLKLLNIVRVDNSGEGSREEVCKEDQIRYLTSLASSLLVKPAESIVTNTKQRTCSIDSSLTYSQPYLDVYADELRETIDSISSSLNGKQRNRFGESSLHVLCKPNTPNAIKEFNKNVWGFLKFINAQDNFGNTPLHDCCKNDNTAMIAELMSVYVRNSKRLNLLNLEQINFLKRNQALETPMHLAVAYCSEGTIELLKCFAEACGVLQDVLLAPNAEGKLPFETAKDPQIRLMLKPEGYQEEALVVQDGFALTPPSMFKLLKDSKSNFALKKILVWWKHNRDWVIE